jgi:hypothetical protein
MADELKPDDDPKPDPETEPKDLGDAGKKALDAERKARRDAESKAKDLEDRLKAIEDKDKSEVERLTEQVATLTKDLSTATVDRDRLKVAISKGLTLTQAKRLVGSNEEELTADADELLADLAPLDDTDPKPTPTQKPREQLKPGSGDPDAPLEETDTKKIGERMFAR